MMGYRETLAYIREIVDSLIECEYIEQDDYDVFMEIFDSDEQTDVTIKDYLVELVNTYQMRDLIGEYKIGSEQERSDIDDLYDLSYEVQEKLNKYIDCVARNIYVYSKDHRSAEHEHLMEVIQQIEGCLEY